MYVAVFVVGPGVVGPFDTKNQAEVWATRYDQEYREMQGPHTLSWRVEDIVAPRRLEWWND